MGKQQRQDRARRILRHSGLAFVLFLAALMLLYTAFRRWTAIPAPDDDGKPLSARVRVEDKSEGMRLAIGSSWTGWSEGVRVLWLEGDARRVGHAHGTLLRRLLVRNDKHVHGLLEAHAPRGIKRWWWLDRHRLRMRNLSEAIAPRRLVELAALAGQLPPNADLTFAAFQRLLFYHASFELVHARGVPPSESVALAAWGDQTVGNALVAARSFTLDGGEPFDREKVLMVVKAPKSMPFAAVGWPGLAGVLTGINAKRIFVALSAARSDAGVGVGTPALFLARRVLEEATSIEQAFKLLKGVKVLGSFSLLVADGKARKAAAIEVSPKRVVLRRPVGRRLVVTDHLLHPKHKGDASNDWVRRYTVSGAHHARAKQLLGRFAGRIDPATLALVLRNRTGLDDAPLALGHRSALDSLRASQGVVADVSNLVLWVNTGPGLLGSFSPIDLKPLFGESTTPPLPKEIAADHLLQDPRYERYRLAREEMRFAVELRARGAWRTAANHAQRAVDAAPDLPEARRILGEIFWQLGDLEQARHQLRRFLALKPALRGEVERIERRLQR